MYKTKMDKVFLKTKVGKECKTMPGEEEALGYKAHVG